MTERTTEITSIGSLLSELVEHQLIDNETRTQFSAGSNDDRPVSNDDLKRLVEYGYLSSVQLAQFAASKTGYRYLLHCLTKNLKAEVSELSGTFLKEALIFPCKVRTADGSLARDITLMLVANPFNYMAVDAAKKALPKSTHVIVAPLDEVEILLEQSLAEGESTISAAPQQDSSNSKSMDMLRDLASGTPVVAIVNELLEQAVDLRATDIHLEPTRGDLLVRYRVDGVLRKMQDRPAGFANAIVSRIKVLANLDIAEKRIPQDGATRLNIRDREIDLRIATLPIAHGESVVLRLLHKNANLASLNAMGMSDRDLGAISRLLDHPYGMIAVTGPTGSGKTTTLAAALTRLNDTSRKIVTIEDPIEYQIENIAQSQVRPEIGATFANAIRAFVRQDPDVIMVGEIRDGDTARAAVQAAQTGHLLLTTLHANTAVAAVARLRDLGVESYLLASNLRGVIAQRLVRTLCQYCKKEHELKSSEVAAESRYQLFGFQPGDRVFTATGCPRCAGTGYRGRAPVFEVVEISEALALAIGDDAASVRLQNIAISEGTTTLPQDAKRRVESGETSPEEILRVTAYL